MDGSVIWGEADRLAVLRFERLRSRESERFLAQARRDRRRRLERAAAAYAGMGVREYARRILRSTGSIPPEHEEVARQLIQEEDAAAAERRSRLRRRRPVNYDDSYVMGFGEYLARGRRRTGAAAARRRVRRALGAV